MKKLMEKSCKHLTGIHGYFILLILLQILVVYILLTSVPKSMMPETDTKEITPTKVTMVEEKKPIIKQVTEPIPTPVIQVAEKVVAVKPSTTTLSRGGEIKVEPVKKLTQHELIDSYVDEICSKYDMDPYLIKSMIVSESDYNPNCTTGKCLGLLQVSTRWHSDRASRLNVTDFYDPYGNILLGVDYLSELFEKYKDKRLVLMLYNMNHETAFNMYNNGEISYYARSIIARADSYRDK